MVRRLIAPCLLFLSNGFAQQWAPISEVPIVCCEDSMELPNTAVALHGSHLCVGNPSEQGHGLVYLCEENSGGAGEWDVVHSFVGDGLIGGQFGRAVVLSGSNLFAAGAQGLWRYVLGEEVVEATQLVDDAGAWAIAFTGEELLSAGPLVPGFSTAVIKRFGELDPGLGYVLTTGLAIQPHSASLASCMGQVMAYSPPNLVVADPCWSTTSAIPVTGMIKTFVVDQDPDTILVDAPDGAYGGYWPFGAGLYLGQNFGRALCLKGDTLFVGFGPAMSGTSAHIEVFRKNPVAGWDRFKQIPVPSSWSGPEIGDLGRAIVCAGQELIVGTDHGLAFFQEVDTGWVFQHFEPLGGAVSSISQDGDLLAAAVPAAGLMYIYERSMTGIRTAADAPTELRITPNPALDHAVVLPCCKAGEADELLVTDVFGRVLERLAWDGRHTLNLVREDHTEGLHLLQALDAQGQPIGLGRVIWLNDRSQ